MGSWMGLKVGVEGVVVAWVLLTGADGEPLEVHKMPLVRPLDVLDLDLESPLDPSP